ncbi:hypothetical protein [Paenibacillus silviterrae]|uniref:hypothetical protein n=1 Tax=Paenibacillus silviterrae TaxID=3242194 RepID=UPI002542B6E0|nr:hypothetical protein [Paenibacillus chinjuensis]
MLNREDESPMSSTPIFFEFETRDEANMAAGTLEELGYGVGLHDDAEKSTLHVIVDGSDLTSALEIAQAHGGRLVEHPGTLSEPATFAMAYEEQEMIPIPAHLVNEDWQDDQIQAPDYVMKDRGSYNDTDHEDPFDPSRDKYDHFDPGIHV